MRAAMERMLAELMNVKTDRSLLAGLFVEIARCLNQDTTAKANGFAPALLNRVADGTPVLKGKTAIGDTVISSVSLFGCGDSSDPRSYSPLMPARNGSPYCYSR